MKKLILAEGTEFEQNGKDLVIIETEDRAGIPVMISSEDFNEACTNGEEGAIALINTDGPKPETVTVTATTEAQTITPTTGKVFDEVIVNAVTAAIDANIVAENIKAGVTILGVEGTYTGEETGTEEEPTDPEPTEPGETTDPEEAGSEEI